MSHSQHEQTRDHEPAERKTTRQPVTEHTKTVIINAGPTASAITSSDSKSPQQDDMQIRQIHMFPLSQKTCQTEHVKRLIANPIHTSHKMLGYPRIGGGGD